MFYKEINFKETPIGKIPKSWHIVKFQDLCRRLKAGGTPPTSKKEYYGGDIPFVKIEDITNAKKYLSSTLTTITKKGLNNSTAWLVPKNSLLVAIYGSLGSVAINTIEVATNQAILGIILKEKAETEFFYYMFSYLDLEKYAKRTTQANLTAEIIKNLKVPLPPYPEQRAIAYILSTVDEAIQKSDEIITKTEHLKKGLMHKLLTEGIGHEEFKDTPIGRIPVEWDLKSLNDIVEVYDSKRVPLSEVERNSRKGNYPYCGANGIIDYIDDYIFDGEYVLLAEDGGDYKSFGKSAYLMTGKFWANNHVHILKAIQEISTNLFILYSLNFVNLERYTVGTTRKKLNQGAMLKIKIPLPPLHEQEKIAEILSKIDELKLKEVKRKEKLQNIKKGLMNDLLTGKRMVKVDS